MEGPAPADSGTGAGGGGGCIAAGSGPAAAGQGAMARGGGSAAVGVVVPYRGALSVPAAARPWFPASSSKGGGKLHVTVYGRRPDGSVKPHDVILHVDQRRREWWLSGIVPLVNHLDVHKGDRVRLTREVVAAAGAAAGGMGVVVEKVAGEQQQQGQQEGLQQHRRRHVRTAMHIGTPKPIMVRPHWNACLSMGTKRVGASWCILCPASLCSWHSRESAHA